MTDEKIKKEDSPVPETAPEAAPETQDNKTELNSEFKGITFRKRIVTSAEIAKFNLGNVLEIVELYNSLDADSSDDETEAV
ncbi:hypothetical protein CJU89_4311 [Yarrowia sp. B02]|nr:hypothetical protein CJU89_4311 [Yarrowia sp. B02]